MRIDVAMPEDCGAIAEVHVVSWQQAYVDIVPSEYLAGLSVAGREALWREALRAGTPHVLVARSEEGIEVAMAADAVTGPMPISVAAAFTASSASSEQLERFLNSFQVVGAQRRERLGAHESLVRDRANLIDEQVCVLNEAGLVH